MTPRERAAFVAGIETARQMAMAAAVTIEVRDDGREVRQQAAAAALQGLADGLKVAFLDAQAKPSPMQRFMAMIVDDGGDSGTVVCPACKGGLAWIKDGHGDHIHAKCETPGCFRLMQ